MQKLCAFLMTIAAIMQIFMPVLLHPENASDILLHGSTGIFAIMGAAFLIGVYWLKRKMDSISDPTAKKAEGAKILRKAVPIGAAILFVPVALLTLNQGQRLAAIQRHGQRATAQVQDIYEDDCDKHSCSIEARYQFRPVNGGGLIVGRARLGDTRDWGEPHLLYARQHGQIPIAYEIGNPGNSDANFDDRAFNADPFRGARILLAVLGGALLFFVIFVEFLLWTSNPKAANA